MFDLAPTGWPSFDLRQFARYRHVPHHVGRESARWHGDVGCLQERGGRNRMRETSGAKGGMRERECGETCARDRKRGRSGTMGTAEHEIPDPGPCFDLG